MKKPSVSSETATRLAEDVLYTVVYEEIENGQIDKAAQARAIAEGGENEGAVRAAYIKHRIARMRAEIEVSVAQAATIKAAEEKNRKELTKYFKDKERPFVLRNEIYATFVLCLIIIILFILLGFL